MSDVDLVVDLMKQWVLLADHTPKGGVIRPKTKFDGPANRNYQLKNKVPRKFLHHEDQIGMNIGWTDNAEPSTATKSQRWFFMRNGENESPIRYGEVLALALGKPPSWVCHEKRTVGVDLQYHDDPCFQWKVLGGRVGQQVKLGDFVALYNTSIKECFIFMDRTVGGDVGWPSSKTWGEQFKDKLGELAGEALEKAIEAGVKALLTGGSGG
jgi:hypothetical protein